jgi:hypothetical protein
MIDTKKPTRLLGLLATEVSEGLEGAISELPGARVGDVISPTWEADS